MIVLDTCIVSVILQSHRPDLLIIKKWQLTSTDQDLRITIITSQTSRTRTRSSRPGPRHANLTNNHPISGNGRSSPRSLRTTWPAFLVCTRAGPGRRPPPTAAAIGAASLSGISRSASPSASTCAADRLWRCRCNPWAATSACRVGPSRQACLTA